MQVEGVNGRGGVGASGEEGLGAAEEGSGEDDDGGGAVLMLAPRRERGEEWCGYLWRLASSSSTPGPPPGLAWRGWEWERRPMLPSKSRVLARLATPPSTAGSLPGLLP